MRNNKGGIMKEESLDFEMAAQKANEILLCARSITTFPFSIESVIEEMSDIDLMPFSAIEEAGLCARQIVGSDDAAIVELDGQLMVFYNDKMPPLRQKFSKGHEFGHACCGHDIALITEMRKAGDSRFEALYAKYEVEANFFAAQLFMPEEIIIELAKRGQTIDEAFLAKTFGVSYEAAEKRMKTVRKSYGRNGRRRARNDGASLGDFVVTKFEAFIHSVAPMKQSYTDSFEREYAMELERQGWQ